jgi:hypothetical protein
MGSKFAMAHVCIILALAPTWIVHAAEPPPDEPPVARYNEAVSLIAQGDATHGAAILDAIGNADAAGPASLALRDQANITLGYYFLRQRNGSAAIPVFSRVRSVGPYANRGLLGLGWAYLAPQGAGAQQAAVIDGASSSSQRIGVVLRPRLTADIEKLRRNQPFRLRQATGDDELALRHALMP